MPKLPRYVQGIWNKKAGKTYYYYRRNGQRIPLEGIPSTKRFEDSWARVHATFITNKAKSKEGEFARLMKMFLSRAYFNTLAVNTKKRYRNECDTLAPILGKFNLADIRRKHVLLVQDKFQTTPGKANNLVSIIENLFNYAIELEMITHNPAAKIKKLNIGEFEPWTDIELEAFKEQCKKDHLLDAFYLAYFTGQRVGDCIKAMWSDYKDGYISVQQEKTDEPLRIPLHSKLAERLTLMKKKRKTLTILQTGKGKPWSYPNLDGQFREARKKAGINKTFHGLRASSAIALAECGCSEKEIAAVTGHKTLDMIIKYTRHAQQKVMANSAIAKLENKNRRKT